MNPIVRKVFLCGCTLVIGATVAAPLSFGQSWNPHIQRLEQDLKVLEQRYTTKHPDVRALRQRIERLKKEAEVEAQGTGETGAPAGTVEGVTEPGDRGHAHEPVRIPLEVHDRTGWGFENYPASTVLPVPSSLLGNTEALRVVDVRGETVPAQFSFLSGRWGDEGRRRYLQVDFMASVPPSHGAASGLARFFLTHDAGSPKPVAGLLVQETPGAVTVVTGPVKCVLEKKSVPLQMSVWLDRDGSGRFEGDEALVVPQSAFLRARPGSNIEGPRSVKLTVEEAGPLKAVLRAEIPLVQGWRATGSGTLTMWVTAYAGARFLHVTTHRLSPGLQREPAPYAGGSELRFRMALRDPVRVTLGLAEGTFFKRERGLGLVLLQDGFDRFRLFEGPGGRYLQTGRASEGFLDVSGSNHGLAAFVRRFAATWPNALGVDAENVLWVATTADRDGARARPSKKENAVKTGSDAISQALAVKEILLFFHDGRTESPTLRKLAALFNTPPEVSSPAWSAQGLHGAD
ncbi:MAG: hypothetical protein ACUVWY_12880 [Desulfosoma sp.]|uniref:hypothetical protein n=1 Tax=Desulfosoma sp. TaxID=2603217 RepID=UPI0040498ADE